MCQYRRHRALFRYLWLRFFVNPQFWSNPRGSTENYVNRLPGSSPAPNTVWLTAAEISASKI